jgi:hypothetical protein
MVRLAWEAPGLLLAEHLEGEQAILIFRVAKLETAVPEIYAPRGNRRSLRDAIRIGRSADHIRATAAAIYEPLTPERGRSLAGRRDC